MATFGNSGGTSRQRSSSLTSPLLIAPIPCCAMMDKRPERSGLVGKHVAATGVRGTHTRPIMLTRAAAAGPRKNRIGTSSPCRNPGSYCCPRSLPARTSWSWAVEPRTSRRGSLGGAPGRLAWTSLRSSLPRRSACNVSSSFGSRWFRPTHRLHLCAFLVPRWRRVSRCGLPPSLLRQAPADDVAGVDLVSARVRAPPGLLGRGRLACREVVGPLADRLDESLLHLQGPLAQVQPGPELTALPLQVADLFGQLTNASLQLAIGRNRRANPGLLLGQVGAAVRQVTPLRPAECSRPGKARQEDHGHRPRDRNPPEDPPPPGPLRCPELSHRGLKHLGWPWPDAFGWRILSQH